MLAERDIKLIISNLELISYQAQELMEAKNSNLYYSDFVQFYNTYILYLRKISNTDETLKKIISKFPSIRKPNHNRTIIAFSLLALLSIIIGPFVLYYYIIVGVPLLLFFLLGYYIWREKNSWQLSKVINTCIDLKSHLLKILEESDPSSDRFS
ncbi:MAG: hypothetical protein K0R51_708 [Cytophagaceae bacterium]|jgi:hypothetical protein|nr:hypothetical protein [Cytophagaceae bacterium]